MRRTRMSEEVIWKHYKRLCRLELVERFRKYAHCERRITYSILLKALKDKGVVVEKLRPWKLRSELNKCYPRYTWTSSVYNNYFYVIFPDANDRSKYRLVTSITRNMSYGGTCIVIPLFNDFCFKFQHWSLYSIVECFAHIHELFEPWAQEIELIKHEIPKRKKVLEMQALKTKLLETRKLETGVATRYSGQCRISDYELQVDAPLGDGHSITIEMNMKLNTGNWGGRMLDMVSFIIDHAIMKVNQGWDKWDEIVGRSLPIWIGLWRWRNRNPICAFWGDLFTLETFPPDLRNWQLIWVEIKNES